MGPRHRRGVRDRRGGPQLVGLRRRGAAATYPLAAAAEQQYAPEQQYAEGSEPAPGPDGPDTACADFASQDEAQAALQAEPSDPYGLDADVDGQACEDSFPEPETAQYHEPNEYEPSAPAPEPSSPDPFLRRPPPDQEAAPPAGDVDCDELDPGEAQAILEEDPSDPHDLDRDDDEKACE